MNANLPEDHVSIRFYDADYPGEETTLFSENFDPTTAAQGLSHDVGRYKELAATAGAPAAAPVLELCCGTGRVAIPLARAGHQVTAVDLSAAMLEALRGRLAQEEAEVRQRLEVVEQDVVRLDLDRAWPLIIMAFNSLLCITDQRDQLGALEAAARHLKPGGILALDLMNPMILPLAGDTVPKPFFTRRHPSLGHRYTRFAAMGPMGTDQRQELFGWYDEMAADGTVKRTPYSMFWRPIFRSELELMLERAGLRIAAIEGGHQKEPFTAQSRKMFVLATPAESPGGGP